MSTTKEARWLSCAETAKLVRGALAREFPGHKFSVRSKTYSGGASIDVSWTDGPTTKEVDCIVTAFESASFDGSIDLACHWNHWLMPDGTVEVAQGTGTAGSLGWIDGINNPAPSPKAELVSFGSHYVQTDRHLSADFLRPIAERIAQEQGKPAPEIKTEQWGAYADDPDDDLCTDVWREAQQISAYKRPQEIATAQPQADTPPARDGNGDGKSSATLGNYKGHPTISLDTGNGQPFSFGLKKAAAILANLEAIARFVQSDGTSIN